VVVSIAVIIIIIKVFVVLSTVYYMLHESCLFVVVYQ
jgi:hypothetical protein